jgi:NDP-sugar pyrophosphorylase family protein
VDRTILDADCVVGTGASLRSSVVGTGTTVGPNSVHEDEVLGDA